MPNQFLSDEFGDIEDYFVTDYWLIDQYIGDQLFTWGTNGDVQLGTNGGGTRSTPVTTFAGGATWKSVSCGAYHTAAIKTDGSLWTWGNNGYGHLGTNDTAKRSTPVTTFAGGKNWKQVITGYAHTSAIKTDGSLWLWGKNSNGQLGDFSTSHRNVPVTTFAGGTTWKQVSCGETHTAAIKTDGSLWVWGRNHNAQLGINNTDQKNTPVTTFAGGNDWKQVACGFEASHTAAIKTDGSLWTWGSNSTGQLGINAAGNRSTPVTTFAGGNNWKSILCGDRRTAAIKTDGTLWNWGLNNGGQLGENGGGNRSIPVTTFAGGNNWKSVGGRGGSTAAIKTDGTLWVWGFNNTAQLGTNDNTQRNTPVTTFAGGNNWKSVDGNATGHTAAIKSGLNVDLS